MTPLLTEVEDRRRYRFFTLEVDSELETLAETLGDVEPEEEITDIINKFSYLLLKIQLFQNSTFYISEIKKLEKK